jgi:gliding motility-associated protein GldM
MAGGKETPRQKMIGMMYLVLTALLALQVSNAVLEKFAIIYETLEELSSSAEHKNSETLKALIDEKGKSAEPKTVKALENARQVRELTKTTLSNIEALKVKMKDLSGTQEVDERLINDHSSKVATMMMSQPEGKQFEKLLNDYVEKLRQLSSLTEKDLPKLARPPKEIPVFAKDEDHANKDFLTFTFENTPVIAALTSVTQVETEILEYESKALEELKRVAGSDDVKFDKIVPMIRSKAAVVAAGATYEADLFISASSTAFQPEMFMNGSKIPVEDVDGIKMGKVKFTAQGGNYNKDGFATKTFKTEIRLSEKSYESVVEYVVAQPTIKVTTGNAPTLYMNCGNNVTIEVPQLGSAYNPSFNGGPGAEIRKGDKPGKVTIIPSQRKFTVAVSNGGTLIGNQPFEAKNIPEPRFVAYIGNTPVDLRQGIKPAQLRLLRIVPEPDENFKEEVPKDARYNIRAMEVTMGSGPVAKQSMNATNGAPDLSAWTNQARAGDRIMFVVRDANRKTFTDKDEKVNIKGSNGVIQVDIK